MRKSIIPKLNVSSSTMSGTIMQNGVEYNAYPPPPSLIKIMKRCWAEKFIKCGCMRFGSLEGYRKWENNILGDRRDGIGMFKMHGHPYTTGSANPVYAWCASKNDTPIYRIRELARAGQYNCLVRIHSPETLIQRVRYQLDQKLGQKLWLHCGDMSYDKESEVSKQTLCSQQFHSNVFQKDMHFSADCEYRLSISDVGHGSIGSQPEPGIVLNIGGCFDIANIENLPSCAYGLWCRYIAHGNGLRQTRGAKQ